MNKGTKIRTALRIATSLQTAICVVTNAVVNLDNKYIALVWVILTITADFVVAYCTTYYNNDYTPEGESGTIYGRDMKALKGFQDEGALEEPEDAEVAEKDLEV